jgi:xylulokinase
LFGLNRENFHASHIARATMEGVTLGMNYGLRRLRALGVKPKEIRVTGGGAKSPVWRQIMADVFGVPIVALREEEGAAMGAALQAAWCVARRSGGKTTIEELTHRAVALNEATRCVPDKKQIPRYRQLQVTQDKLSLALRERFVAQRG